MEENNNQLSRVNKTEPELLPKASQQLIRHLEAKDIIQVKHAAMILAPGGKPNFELIFTNGSTCQLSTLSRTYGPQMTAKLIFVMLEDLNTYFNVARPMTSGQMTDLAIEMAASLWSYRLEEIVAFSEAVKKGTYGKIYERLDPAIIWEQLEAHEQARSAYFFSTHEQYKQSDPKVETDDDDIKRGFSKLSGAMSQIKSNLKR